MHILVNALSVTNTSGRHVLVGHLTTIKKLALDNYTFTVLSQSCVVVSLFWFCFFAFYVLV